MLEAVSKIYQHSKAKTMVLTLPSILVTDSQFSFKAGNIVEIFCLPDKLIIKKKKED